MKRGVLLLLGGGRLELCGISGFRMTLPVGEQRFELFVKRGFEILLRSG